LDWVEIVIKTTYEAKEAVTNILHEAMVEGIVIEDPSDIISLLKSEEYRWDYLDEDLVQDYYDGVVIKGYFKKDEDTLEKMDFIKEQINRLPRYDLDIGMTEIEIQNIENKDWNSEWKKHFKTLRLGRNVVIKPSWEDYDPEDDDIVISIDPGAAFGTGSHETTSLCIEALEKYIKPESDVLDIGTGSGILAILSSKLGANKVLGIDIDEDSIRVSKENVQLNKCSNIQIEKNDLLDNVDYKADIVVANITLDIILQMITKIQSVLKPNGLFIASGILAKKIDEIKLALTENQYTIVSISEKGEWVSVTAQKAVA